MSARTAARLGWFLFVASVLLFVCALVLNLGRPQYADLAFTTGELVLGLALLVFGWFGALIVSRQPSHPIGWVLCGFGLLAGAGGFASEYAIYGLRSHPGAVPGAAALAWFAYWVFALELAVLTALLLLFPNGRPPSPRWRWVLWLAGIGAATLEDVAGLAGRRVPARARLSSLAGAQDGGAAAASASAAVPVGAAHADDLRGHAGGDARAAPLARSTTRRRINPGRPVSAPRNVAGDKAGQSNAKESTRPAMDSSPKSLGR